MKITHDTHINQHAANTDNSNHASTLSFRSLPRSLVSSNCQAMGHTTFILLSFSCALFIKRSSTAYHATPTHNNDKGQDTNQPQTIQASIPKSLTAQVGQATFLFMLGNKKVAQVPEHAHSVRVSLPTRSSQGCRNRTTKVPSHMQQQGPKP